MPYTQKGFTPPVNEVAPGPCAQAYAVTPSDTVALPSLTRVVWVGSSGDVAFQPAGSVDPVTLRSVLAGTQLPICASLILATGTTAGDIIALW